MPIHSESAPPQPGGGDRRLGEEWEDWDGNQAAADTRAPAALFFGVAALWMLIAAAALWGAVWLAWPRLAVWGGGRALQAAAWAGTLWLAANWSAASLASAGVSWLQAPARWLGGIRWTLEPVLVIGRALGLGRDRLMHAFIAAHNRLERLPPLVRSPERLLVLLPRCLSREVFQALAGLKQRYGFTQVTVGGGTEARRAIGKLRPQGIVAVACERDLVSGLKDLAGRVPALAFANRRPEGPCKNTDVDLAAVETAVRRFLGRPADGPGTTPAPAGGGKGGGHESHGG